MMEAVARRFLLRARTMGRRRALWYGVRWSRFLNESLNSALISRGQVRRTVRCMKACCSTSMRPNAAGVFSVSHSEFSLRSVGFLLGGIAGAHLCRPE